ncbi:MAG: hypothetical protein HY334_08555 [Armatimonadetes bacterium]|nr:hypothetical protein [Armatimonadota bacterium]
MIADNRVWFGETGNNAPRRKAFASEAREGLTPHTLWAADQVGTNDSAKKELIELFDGVAVFETPKPWNAEAPHDTESLAQQLEMHIDHIRDGRTADDLLHEILLKSGFPLTTPVEALTLAGKTVQSVAGGALLICLEREVTLELIRGRWQNGSPNGWSAWTRGLPAMTSSRPTPVPSHSWPLMSCCMRQGTAPAQPYHAPLPYGAEGASRCSPAGCSPSRLGR